MILIVFEIARSSSVSTIWEYVRYRNFLQTESFLTYFYGLLKRDHKNSLKSVIGVMLDGNVFVKATYTLVFTTRPSLSLRFLQQILLHLGKLYLRNDALLS